MTKIIYTSVHPHTTWRLKMSYNVKKPPKKLLVDLGMAGWASRVDRGPGEIDITYPGSDSFAGDWTSEERETAMANARRVLAKHGFDVVPYHQLEMADCI